MANLVQYIDYRTIEKFDPACNPTGMLEVSSFSRRFPQHRANYLLESWPKVESALNEYGVACNLNLVEGCMTVATTSKTRDPYIIVKARDLLRLLSRSIDVYQAILILRDDMYYDVINIRNLVRKKMLEFFTGCYILVQGSTVAAMGSIRGIKKIRNVVEDCMRPRPYYTWLYADSRDHHEKDSGNRSLS